MKGINSSFSIDSKKVENGKEKRKVVANKKKTGNYDNYSCSTMQKNLFLSVEGRFSSRHKGIFKYLQFSAQKKPLTENDKEKI